MYELDILNAKVVGIEAFNTFIQKRLVSKTLKPRTSHPIQSLTTFGSLDKNEEAKVLEDEDSPNITPTKSLFIELLILSEDNFSLQKVLQHPHGSVTWGFTYNKDI